MNQTENLSDLQPFIEVPNSAIINAVRSESYKDSRWKVWLKAAQHYWSADGEGKEILEVLHLGSQVVGLIQLGICFSFDLCKCRFAFYFVRFEESADHQQKCQGKSSLNFHQYFKPVAFCRQCQIEHALTFASHLYVLSIYPNSRSR